jgi:hypothetical protein
MLVARNELWDHWPWNPALVIMMTLNFVIALASVVVLQRAARAAKNAAEVRLTSKLKTLRAQVAPSSAQNDADQAEKLLDEIKSIRRGAFVSIWDNPVIGALLIGPGGLTLLQMAIWLMQR